MTWNRRPLIRQRNSHLPLLGQAKAPKALSRLDAIIVPASRPASNLDHAVTLARAAHCRLVILCSKDAYALDVLRLIDDRSFHNGVVIAVAGEYEHSLFEFKTTRWAREMLPRRDSDLSAKRNIGLALARLLGWKRIFFMDDDIRDIDASSLLRTVSMLDVEQTRPAKYNSVGMFVHNFPDNSVACYAHRLTGESQEVFISGSVLAIECNADIGFFPDVYNEDWLFFYRDAANSALGSSNVSATQLRFDPFASPQRAAAQEFGDVLAEGLYALLEHGTKAGSATEDDWQGFLDDRKRFLRAILARSDRAPQEIRESMVAAIDAALASLAAISPDMCLEYTRDWHADLKQWGERLGKLPTVQSIDEALGYLDLAASRIPASVLPDGVALPSAPASGPAKVPKSRLRAQ